MPEDVHQLPHPGVVFIKMRKPKVRLTSAAMWRKDVETEELLELVELLKAPQR